MLSVRASHWPGHLLHLLLIGCLSCLADPCPVCYGSVPIYKHGQSRDIVRQMSKTRHDLGHGSAAPRLFLFHIETINYHSHSVRDSQRLMLGGKLWASHKIRKLIQMIHLITGHRNQFCWSRIYFLGSLAAEANSSSQINSFSA